LVKKIVKRIAQVFSILLILLYCIFYFFSTPKSDKAILEKFEDSNITPKVTHENFNELDFRKITIQKNDSLPTIVFVHGAIGSLNDFNAYLTDSLIQAKANMIAFDRIGYSYKDEQLAQENISLERDVLQFIIKDLDKAKTIIVGYSFGGPIALSVKQKVKKIVLLAPALYGEFEVFPWVLNFYKWKATRWLVPKVWKEASKEKMSHQQDLKEHEEEWKNTPNTIVSIHGNEDWIVPYENSERLHKEINKNQFELITIQDAGHGLVWSNFNEIKKELLKILD